MLNAAITTASGTLMFSFQNVVDGNIVWYEEENILEQD